MSSQAVTVGADVARTRAGHRAFSGAGLLSAAMVGSGVLAYAFFVLAARTLDTAAYGQVGVLWAGMFIGVIVLFRPLEQTTTRAIAERVAHGREIRTVVVSVSSIYLAAVALGTVGAALSWQTLTDRLFLGSNLLTAMLFVGTALYGLEYILRGILAGTGWFRGYALCLMADAVVRVAVAAPLLFVASKDLAGVAIAAAGLGGFLVPFWVGYRRIARVLVRGEGAGFAVGHAVTFAGPASVIAAADQVLINAGPLLVMVDGGRNASATAGVVFAATMLVRIPVYVFQGVAASLLPNLTRLQAAADMARFRHALGRAAVVLTGTTLLLAVFAVIAGPEAMRAIYGKAFVADRTALALLGVGVGFYLGAATFSQALLALDRGKQAAVAWTLGAFAFLALYFAVPGDELMRIAVSFAIGTGLCCALIATGLAGRMRR